jgi:hypothetical protein
MVLKKPKECGGKKTFNNLIAPNVLVLCFSCAYTQTTFGTIEQNTCYSTLFNLKNII